MVGGIFSSWGLIYAKCLVNFFSHLPFSFPKGKSDSPRTLLLCVSPVEAVLLPMSLIWRKTRHGQHSSRLPLSYRLSLPTQYKLHSSESHDILHLCCFYLLTFTELVPPHPLGMFSPLCTSFSIMISHCNSKSPRELQDQPTINLQNQALSSF